MKLQIIYDRKSTIDTDMINKKMLFTGKTMSGSSRDFLTQSFVVTTDAENIKRRSIISFITSMVNFRTNFGSELFEWIH